MTQKHNPFKFLDSYTKDDRDIFFGRDREIEELYARIFESKILLLYGISGTGKSSLINCGVANKFNDSDWLPINIRRGNNINESLAIELSKNILTEVSTKKKPSSKKLIQSVYLDHFKPIYLIFDQFEEIFIFGDKQERTDFIESVKSICSLQTPCKFIFSIREEYLAGVTEFEETIPEILSNRFRLEKMTRNNAKQAIEGPCRVSSIDIEDGFSDKLIEKLSSGKTDVELTYLQVYLDKAYRLSLSINSESTIVLTNSILEKLGDTKDLLGSFLEEQIAHLDDPDTGLTLLKSFVSVKGTKRQNTENEIIDFAKTLGKNLQPDTIRPLILKFINLRILREKDENNRYELRHDSLAEKIYEKITLVEKDLLEVRQFIEDAFKNYQKRTILLRADDLKYIAPYEDKLYLNDELNKFIAKSKNEILKTKRRNQYILIGTAAAIIIILSFFTFWAFKEKNNALAQQRMAEVQKNKAILAKEEAEKARHEAEESKKMAENNEQLAIRSKNAAESAKKEALIAKENVVQEKNRAEHLAMIAQEQTKKTEIQKNIANQQKDKAETAEQKTKQLSLLSLAQNLSMKSALLDKTPELMGLLAVQAFNINLNNGGKPDDPFIFEGLSKAYSTLDHSKHSVFTGSPTESKALIETGNEIGSVDLDGQIRLWNYEGTFRNSLKLAYPSAISFIGCNPSGNLIITGHDNFTVCVWNIYNNIKKRPENKILKGHNGLIHAIGLTLDEKFLATAGKDSSIIVWDVQSKIPTIIQKIKTTSAVKSIVFCGKDTLIFAQENGRIILHDIKKSENKIIYSSHAEKPLCLAWNPIKKVLLAGCSNGLILSFQLNQPNTQQSVKFAVHVSGIYQIVFNKDFSLVATSCWDQSIKIYNYHMFFELSNTAGMTKELKNTNCRARTLFFNKENKLIGAMSDKSIRVWETSSLKLSAMICDLLKRDMTKTEWDELIGQDIPYKKTCEKKP